MQKTYTKLTFKEAWTFPEVVEKRISKFIKSHPGKWLHAPVGISKIGLGPFDDTIQMTTLDINPELKPDIICDVFQMTEKLGREKFDGVISDPIWYTKEKNKTVGLAYPQRRFLSYQVRDVLKPGGWFIFNGLWNPIVKGLKIDRVEVPMQAFSSFRNLSLLVYLQKINHSL